MYCTDTDDSDTNYENVDMLKSRCIRGAPVDGPSRGASVVAAV
jgi:hypothetical protein